MAKGTMSQRRFTTGELRPDMAGQTDIQKYASALKLAKNVWINKAGVLYNTPGTVAVLPEKYPTKKTRLIPFKISFNQQYQLVFGDMYMHIIKNGAPVFNFGGPQQITSFPNASNPTITVGVGSATFNSGNMYNGLMAYVSLYNPNTLLTAIPNNSAFAQKIDGLWVLLTNVSIGVSTTTFEVTTLSGATIDSTTWGTYDNSLTISFMFEVTTPYAYTDLPLLKYAQSFDILQLRHPSYPRQQLEYTSDTSWLLTPTLEHPTTISDISIIFGAEGASGSNEYDYKVTIQNLATGDESYPMPTGSPLTPQNEIQQLQTKVNHGNSVGGAMQLSFMGQVATINYNDDLATITTKMEALSTIGSGNMAVTGSSGVTSIQTMLQNGTGSFGGSYLAFTFVGALASAPQSLITIVNYGPGSGQTEILDGSGEAYNVDVFQVVETQVGQGSYVTIGTVITDITYDATNERIIITVNGSHGLSDGDEVILYETGSPQLDHLIFNVVVASATQVYIYLNGANYGLPITTGFMRATTIKIKNAAAPTLAAPNVISWALNPDELNNYWPTNVTYNIYGGIGGVFGFIGTTQGMSFTDPGIPPDTTLTPKAYKHLFVAPDDYPSACNFYQQRLIELATNNNPQGLWASVIGDYQDFSTHDPIQQDDAVILNIWSTELSQIFDSADDGFLILMTDMGPMVAAGDTNGEFTPDSNLIRRYMFAGSAQTPRPLTIFKNVVYLEASTKSMRDLEILVTPFYTYIDKSNDVSLLSEHLFQQSQVIAWDYKLYPDSQIIAVRADGKLIFCTYFQEEQINAFTWGDTQGTWEDVCCVQESTETATYLAANRTNGRWIERMASRYFSDPTADAIFEHGTVTYDGQLPITDTTGASTSGTLSGNNAFGGVITFTSGSSEISQIPVGAQVNFRDSAGNVCRIIVQSSSGNTLVGGAMEAFNPSLLTEIISDIRYCTNVVTGLQALNGQVVQIVADGFVLPTQTVANGMITLPPNRGGAGVIHVGLGYVSQMQTLDIDEPKAETFTDKLIGVPRVTFKLYQTGDIQVGPDFNHLDSPKLRQTEGYDTPTGLFSGILQVSCDMRFGFGGSFVIQNSNPLPLCLLSINPLVEIQS